MKIAVVWPESTFLIDPMVYPPLGALYVAECLRRNGVQVQFIDMDEETDPPHINWALYNQVWFSGTTPQASRLKYWGEEIREVWGVKTVLGGPHATMYAQEMTEYFDLVVKGELNTENASDVVSAGAGILDLGLTEDMSTLPVLSRREALRYHAELEGRKCTSLMTSLGCPYSCAFCSSQTLYRHRVRYLPLDTVLADIERSYDLGFRACQFYDDILPLRRERTLEIADALRYNEMKWRCFMRSDLGIVNGFGFLADLAASGLVEVLVGVESASNTIKRNVHKGTTIEQDTQFLEWCKELGISYKASVILGLPGETLETMEMTRQWLLRYKPERVDVNVLIPMPGTPITDHPERFDCRIVVQHPDDYFYKGRPDEVVAVTETASLTPHQIDVFREKLLCELRGEGIPY